MRPRLLSLLKDYNTIEKPSFQMTNCPQCRSTKTCKDGLRYLMNGYVAQRFLCLNCGYRFSEQTPPNHKNNRLATLDVSAMQHSLRAVETLAQPETRQEVALREGTADTSISKGKLVEFAWHLKKQGRKQTTIDTYRSYLNILVCNGVDIQDPEAVKDFLARTSWKDTSKQTLCRLYSTFLKFQKLQWEPPAYRSQRKIPFIPTEEEMDRFIAASGKKLAAALQTAKETAMRIGEISRLKWTDIDFQNKIVFCNDPEKNCNPGIYNVSSKLIGMLNTIPRRREYIFGPSPRNLRTLIAATRKTILRKLSEPRLAAIHFHTFRHWKATTLYHETQNVLLVKEFLRHKNLDSTLIYIQLEKALYKERNDSFTVMAIKDPEQIKAMLEVGFEYVCQKDDLFFLRKRK